MLGEAPAWPFGLALAGLLQDAKYGNEGFLKQNSLQAWHQALCQAWGGTAKPLGGGRRAMHAIGELGVPKSGGWQALGGATAHLVPATGLHKIALSGASGQVAPECPPMTPQAQPRPWGVVGLPTHASHKLHCTCLGACCPTCSGVGPKETPWAWAALP